jgi:uncharacterized Ntn-hydrolase superfamily protein|tara:strand:- start:668 stop:991 length:324 start_codon:yes stop_codon:yes gene_type:complete
MKRTVIEKNSRESIVVSNTEYKGNKYVDIRVFYKDGPDDELKPTRKGVSLRPEQVAALVTALTDQSTDEDTDDHGGFAKARNEHKYAHTENVGEEYNAFVSTSPLKP